MPSKQKHFFATKDDWAGALQRLETERSLTYHRAGLLPSPEVEKYTSLLQWPSLGFHPTDSHVTGVRFVVLPRDIPLHVRECPQVRGGIRFAVDQLVNPSSLILWPGGVHDNQYVIVGHIGTCSSSPDSAELYRWFTRRLFRGFTTMGIYHVGPGAMALARSGHRLITMHTQDKPECDLRVDPVPEQSEQVQQAGWS